MKTHALPPEVNHDRIIVDLRKVQWAKLFWVNQTGQCRDKRPNVRTVNGEAFDESAYALLHIQYPCETMLERALRLDLIDVWTPVLRMQLSANHTLEYTGKKALSLWKAWNARIFSKRKQTNP